MEGDRRQAERLGVDLGAGEAFGPFRDVVKGEVERVENGAAGRGNVSMAAAQLGLDIRDRGSAHGIDP
jgi:hypothetical protein